MGEGWGGKYFCRVLIMQIFAAASAATGVDCFSDWKFVVVWIFWAANLVLDNWAVSRSRDFGQFRSLRKARLLQQAINVFLLLSSLSFTTIVCFEGHVKYMYEWGFFFLVCFCRCVLQWKYSISSHQFWSFVWLIQKQEFFCSCNNHTRYNN
jgi:hypothetical protein